jgi:hypothetical protein
MPASSAGFIFISFSLADRILSMLTFYIAGIREFDVRLPGSRGHDTITPA